jgi:hypothetical protein
MYRSDDVSLIARIARCDLASRVDYKFLSKKRCLTERSTRKNRAFRLSTPTLAKVSIHCRLLSRQERQGALDLRSLDQNAIFSTHVKRNMRCRTKSEPLGVPLTERRHVFRLSTPTLAKVSIHCRLLSQERQGALGSLDQKNPCKV